MSRKREAVIMGIGIFAGLALSGPVVQAADYLTAAISTQTFYVSGQQVQFEAYMIHGNNFVKLRDIGKAILWGLRDQYPVGTYYGPFYRSSSNGPYGMAPANCAGLGHPLLRCGLWRSAMADDCQSPLGEHEAR